MLASHCGIHSLYHSPYPSFTMSSIHPVINSPCHPFTITSIHQNIHSSCQPVTKSSIHRVFYLSCHLFTILSIHHHGPCHPFMSSSHQFTMPSSHLIIHSPCHQFTLTMSSIHHAIQLGSWSLPFIYHVIHSLFTSQSPSHSDPISSYHPGWGQVTRPEELNHKEFLVLLETTLARGASTLGQILLSLFCLCYLPLLLAPSDPPPFHCL